jgi:release factor glutamine methyltransferase
MAELERGAAAASVAAARQRAVRALRAAGIEDAGLDVRRLLAAALGVSEAALLARPERLLEPERARLFAQFIARRQRREPVSRILGQQVFYGRSFAVSPATLDPRPDSETLVEAVLDIVRGAGSAPRPLKMVDVGTGTGCLILTLLGELPRASGLGTDLSAAAIAVARGNARALGLDQRVAWQVGDLLENVAGAFHILVANLPYVRSAEIATLAPEVSRFDPHLALDGGPDGLAIIRRLCAPARQVVREGWIVLEVGEGQADRVAELLRRTAPPGRSEEVRFYRDVSGRRRCVAVRTRN